MSTTTALLLLVKQADTENQEIDVLNANLQKIDDYLRASARFVPLPLGANGTDAANFNTPFGYQAAYVDMGDHFLLRGVVGRINTAVSLDSSHILGRLPAGAGFAQVQYWNAPGSGTAIVPVQVNQTGTIAVKTNPTNASYWASLDGLRVWKL